MWNVSNVRYMNAIFYEARSFNQPLNKWNVSNVTDMNSMFYQAESFNQPLNNWNVSNVTNMRGMFWNATSFNQPLNNWNVSNVTDMIEMFNPGHASTAARPSTRSWRALVKLRERRRSSSAWKASSGRHQGINSF